MNVLVVLANPKPQCFTRDICQLYCEEVARRGHEVVLRDLYRMNFNPVASAEDITGNLTGNVAEDVRVEQQYLRRADIVTFVHPIWWIDRPAILKGYVDRVFALGFAYGYAPGGVQGTLRGKRAVIISSSGSPQAHFDESGKMQAIRVAQDMGTMEFCDMEMLGHLHFAPVGRRSSAEDIEGYRQTVRDFVARHFGEVRAAAGGSQN
ncbi:MAG: NAD(P)H-dependent oxidoreductase [Alphaproteobacteria bacterium]|nr:NAD(P)H-dependent oxidoreductase [Alphaproteobacteria bacterium]